MSVLMFAPATKQKAKARIALQGPAGSGKTYSALRLGRILGDRIALIDTEHRSASKYADLFAFDTLQLDRFHPQVLIDALAAAGAANYPVVIVDSLSHFWMGVDGMLEQVDQAAKRTPSNSSFVGWKEVRPIERRMVEALLAYPGHVIVTMRTKSEWVVEDNGKEKKVPRRIGTKPEQREGLEYEFDVVGELDLDNNMIISKTRCPALTGAVISPPDEDLARTIADWLDDGAQTAVTVAQLRGEAVSDDADRESLRALWRRVQAAGLLGAPVLDLHGAGTTLGDLIAQRGDAVAARPTTTSPTRQDEEPTHAAAA